MAARSRPAFRGQCVRSNRGVVAHLVSVSAGSKDPVFLLIKAMCSKMDINKLNT